MEHFTLSTCKNTYMVELWQAFSYIGLFFDMDNKQKTPTSPNLSSPRYGFGLDVSLPAYSRFEQKIVATAINDISISWTHFLHHEYPPPLVTCTLRRRHIGSGEIPRRVGERFLGAAMFFLSPQHLYCGIYCGLLGVVYVCPKNDTRTVSTW